MNTFNHDTNISKINKELLQQKKRLKRFNQLVQEMKQYGGKNNSLNNFVTNMEMNNLHSSNERTTLIDNIN